MVLRTIVTLGIFLLGPSAFAEPTSAAPVVVVASSGGGQASEPLHVTPASRQGVSRGDDLTAWQLLEARRLTGAVAIESYRRFVVAYGMSPLAVAAWGRLVDLGGAGGEWAEEADVRGVLASIRKQWDQSQRALAEIALAPRTLAVIDVAEAMEETEDTGR